MIQDNWSLHSAGLVWTKAMQDHLSNMWLSGKAFTDIARHCGRSSVSIACKIRSLNPNNTAYHVDGAKPSTWFNPNNTAYHVDGAKPSTWFNPNPPSFSSGGTVLQPQPLPKPMENNMSKFTEIKNAEATLDNLRKALTLDDYITEIAKHEACMTHLNALTNKPNAVVAKIKSHRDRITDLIKACDEQFSETD